MFSNPFATKSRRLHALPHGSKFLIAATLASTWFGAHAARAASQSLDFESVPDGGAPAHGDRILGYPEAGVEFPNPLVFVQCEEDGVIEGVGFTNCRTARSGSFASRTLLDTEFQREIYEARFVGPVDSVTAYVRYDGDAGLNGEEIAVVLNSFDETDNFLGSRTVRFEHNYDDGEWHEVSFSPPPPIFGGDPEPIRRIEIWGGRFGPGESPDQDLADNFLLVDDLSFEGEVVPPPEDNEPPEILISSPDPGTAVEGETVGVDLRVADNQRLASIDARVVHESGTVVLDFSGGNICGGGATGSCPERVFEEPVTIPLAGTQGRYSLTIRACDSSGNCAEENRDLYVSRPRGLAVEINQGVAPRLWLPGQDNFESLGLMVDPPNLLPIVPERDTAVRYYLGAGGASMNDITARLDLEVVRRDGERRNWEIAPNAGTTTVQVEELSEDTPEQDRYSHLLQMRANRSATLNYVIPKEALAEADHMILQWTRTDGALEGMTSIEVHFNQAARLGLLITRVVGGGTGDPVARSAIEDTILPYIESMFPISGDIMVDWQPIFHWGGLGDREDMCYSLTEDVRRAYWGSETPAGADYSTVLGFAGNIVGCSGYGFYDTQGATSQSQADTAAQEIAHNMGLNHAGNNHNEDGGGRIDWENWPYEHGTIGSSRLHADPPAWGNFGVVMRQDEVPGLDDLGQWTLWIIDPCPGVTPAERTPDCMAPDSLKPHDFMSYGPGVPIGPFGSLNWISDVNYHRIYEWIARRNLDPPVRWMGRGMGEAAMSSASTASGGHTRNRLTTSSISLNAVTPSRIEALLVSAVLHGDEVGSLELLRKPLTSKFLTPADPDGALTMEWKDADGGLILRHSFEPVQTTSHGEPAQSIQEALPYREGIHQVRILRDGEVLISREASPNLPAVNVVAPNGGEILPQGPQLYEWEAEDADGDRLRFLVQFSPDGGDTWQPLGMVSGSTREIEVPVEELQSGRRGLLSVSATDGLGTSRDESDGYFSVGTATPPNPQPEILSIQSTENGAVRMEIRGQPDHEYAIESSSNLESWSPSDNLILDEPAEVVTEPAVGSMESRFYRVRLIN